VVNKAETAEISEATRAETAAISVATRAETGETSVTTKNDMEVPVSVTQETLVPMPLVAVTSTNAAFKSTTRSYTKRWLTHVR